MPGTILACGAAWRDDGGMRYESCITSLSWIPSEAVTGGTRMAFDAGFTHYDDPPPDRIGDIEALRATDKFRFANVLRAWVEVNASGAITGCGYDGGGMMGSTKVRLGALSYRVQAVKLRDIQPAPARRDGWVRFVQTVGGRTGMPAPRRGRRKPFVQWEDPPGGGPLARTLAP